MNINLVNSKLKIEMIFIILKMQKLLLKISSKFWKQCKRFKSSIWKNSNEIKI